MSEENILDSQALDAVEESVETEKTNVEAVAEDYGIKVSRPKEVPVTDNNFAITSPGTQREGGLKKPNLSPNTSGIMTSSAADKKDKPKPVVKKEKVETVAIHSTKNVTWSGVGKVYRGYNIVPKDAGEKWLTRNHTRLATPEEVKQEFGK